jgi:hypothetical protein
VAQPNQQPRFLEFVQNSSSFAQNLKYPAFVLDQCRRGRLRENQLGNGHDFFPFWSGTISGKVAERVKQKPISTRESPLSCLTALQDVSARWIVIQYAAVSD